MMIDVGVFKVECLRFLGMPIVEVTVGHREFALTWTKRPSRTWWDYRDWGYAVGFPKMVHVGRLMFEWSVV